MQLLQSKDDLPPRRATAVIVPCASRKTKVARLEASAVSLPLSSQTDLETVWSKRVSSFDRTLRADALYSGRGMALSREAARETGAPLFIVSAGFGLVKGDELIAPYAMTVASRGSDAIAARINGRFDPQSWWSAVTRGLGTRSIASLIEAADAGPVLIALTRPYAAMLAGEFASIPEQALSNVRLFGWMLEGVLDPRLHDYVMPYDGRLDAAFPGTRCDFPQRALLHFSRTVLGNQIAAAERHRASVIESMGRFTTPERAVRPRATDNDILAWIVDRIGNGRGIGRLLKAIRNEGIACEQARFSRLYRQALEGRIAA